MDDTALVLIDDRYAERFFAPDATSAIVLSTPAFLQLLEEAQIIQSAQAVLKRAEERGRTAARGDPFAGMLPEAKEFLLNALGRKP